MPETITDPKLVVRDLLRAGWDNTNVPIALTQTDLHVGWYNDGLGFPQVTVSNRDENVSGGGATGFSAIAGDGSGGIQDRTGTVLVTAFAGSREDYNERGLEQLQASDMGDEISRIVGENNSPGEYLTLAVGPRADITDTDASPTEHGVQFQIRYSWRKSSPPK